MRSRSRSGSTGCSRSPSRRPGSVRALVVLLVLSLLAPAVAGGEPQKLDWETGEGKSYAIPALEVSGFIFGLNQFNRRVIDSKEYGSDFKSIGDNLTHPLVIDRDPFSVNQLGHPYHGNIYFGFAVGRPRLLAVAGLQPGRQPALRDRRGTHPA